MTSIVSASFDILHVVKRLQQDYAGLGLGDVQAIAYLGCLLSVYNGAPSSEWGYAFVSSGPGAFSVALLHASERLEGSGDLANDERGRYRLTPRGEVALTRLGNQSRFSKRLPALNGAVEAALAMPLPAVKSSLAHEPQLARASMLRMPAALLDEMGVSALHEDFSVLEKELGRDVDLMLPAVVWLSFLLKTDAPSAEVSTGTDRQ